MVLARCEFDATDEAGNLLSGVTVEVRLETGGLISVYSDRAGTVALGNPFVVSDGKVGFHAAGGAYKITLTQGAYTRILRYVANGLAAETDLQLSNPQGAWSSSATYGIGDLVSVTSGSDVFLFVSLVAANLNHAPDSTTPGDTTYWMYAGKASQGPPGVPGLIGVWRGAWVTATSYAVNDAVAQAGSSYICLVAHTSGVFATDLAASKWGLVAAKGDTGTSGSPAEVIHTFHGGI